MNNNLKSGQEENNKGRKGIFCYFIENGLLILCPPEI